jgi:hypothetical protein
MMSLLALVGGRCAHATAIAFDRLADATAFRARKGTAPGRVRDGFVTGEFLLDGHDG